MIEKQIKKRFGTWAAFCSNIGHDKSNFKRKLFSNINKINNWLGPLDLEIKIVLKKQKRGAEN